jgi:hypothetical protein
LNNVSDVDPELEREKETSNLQFGFQPIIQFKWDSLGLDPWKRLSLSILSCPGGLE